MNHKTNRIAQVNYHLSTLLVCAGGGAGVANMVDHHYVWWGAVLGALLSVGLALRCHKS